MHRVNLILRHPLFAEKLARMSELEKDRVFCRHGTDHLLDVARLAYILSLESGANEDKEFIYAAALLHDLGRARQYEDGTPHEQERARLAETILPECGFNDSESEKILDAILSHRTQNEKKPGFPGYIYRADKLSRRCFECAAETDCDWSKKNIELEY